MRMRRAATFFALAGVILGASSLTAMAIRHELAEESLISAVRAGGTVIYLRHAAREKGAHDTLQPTSSWIDFADCTRQRNLTPAGQEEARQLGLYLRISGVQASRIIALPLCRTRDTAILAFGKTVLDRAMYDPAYVAARLAEPPVPGTNTVLVGSEFQLRQITGFQLKPAEMAVFRPDGRGGAALLGRLEIDDWFDD